MAIALDSGPAEAAPVRRPGDFARHPHNGAPFVADPERTSKPKGTKAELIEQCRERGIEVPDKVTVAKLQELLGPRPSMVMYGRPSSLGKIIEDATNLQKWAERAVALGLFLDTGHDAAPLLSRLDDLTPEQLNLDDPDTRVVLDEVATLAKNVARTGLAAERGTHHHALTEDNDEGRDWLARAAQGEDLGVAVEAQAALVAAWNLMLAESGLEILATEAAVVDDRWRQAGTLDRIARATRELKFTIAGGELVTIPAGWVGVLDIKTGRLRTGNDAHPDYWHGYAVQLASYAQARPYDPDTDTRGEWPFEIDQRWSIIAHLDVLSALAGEAKCRLVLVDLEAGRQAGDLCVAAKSWGKRRDVFSLVTGDEWVVPVQVPTTEPGVDTAAAQSGSVQATAVPTAAVADTFAAQPQPAQLATEEVAQPAASVAEIAGEAVPVRPLAASPAPSEGPGVASPAPSAAAAGVTNAPSEQLTTPAAAPTDEAAERAALRERQQAMRSTAKDTGWVAEFDRLWRAAGITATSTNAEIKAALDSIEPPFDDVVPPVPRQLFQPVPAEHVVYVPAADVDALVALIAASPQRDVVNAWLSASHEIGQSWSPRVSATERNVAVARAAWLLAESCSGDEEYVRLLIAQVLPDAAQPAISVAAAIAALTLDEARRVALLAEAFGSAVELRFTDVGQPFLLGVDQVLVTA